MADSVTPRRRGTVGLGALRLETKDPHQAQALAPRAADLIVCKTFRP